MLLKIVVLLSTLEVFFFLLWKYVFLSSRALKLHANRGTNEITRYMVAILQKLPGTHLFIEACFSKLMFIIFINFTCLSNMTHYIRHSKHLRWL